MIAFAFVIWTASSEAASGSFNVTISNAPTSNITQTGSAPVVLTANAAGANVNVANLTALLSTDGVRIDAGAPGPPEPGNITLIDPLSWASSNQLQLNAAAGAAFNAALNAASGGLTVNASQVTQTAPLTVGGATTLNGAGGMVTLTNSSNNFFGLGVNKPGGTVSVTDTNAIDLGGSSAANLAVDADGAITQSGPLNITADTDLDAGAGNITASNPLNAIHNATLAGANVTVNRIGPDPLVFVDTSSISGDLNVTSGGPVNVGGTLTVTGPTFQANGTAVNILAGGTLGGTATLTTPTLTNSGALHPGTSTTPGQMTLTGNLVQTGTGTLFINANGTAAGTGYDRLNVAGNANAAGTLRISTGAGFSPAAGTRLLRVVNLTPGTFSGSFSPVIDETLTDNISWAGDFLSDAMDLLSGLDAAPLPPDNSFRVKLKKKKKKPIRVKTPHEQFIEGLHEVLFLMELKGIGRYRIRDRGGPNQPSPRAAAAAALLKPVSGEGGPGTIRVPLTLTGRGARILKSEGKVPLTVEVTFTPVGGTSATRTVKVTFKI